ncbi:hypothetical protein EFL76_09310 [Weissella confusa]|uniref:hypothetical protein n=1 Tax=Weissella confusa TaxID=1583 RepID=UPI0016809510|nr:hypothetical protein [Weissella confusa]MCT0009502.1 hypothetical protein [Weissella confusa]MCT0025817.1 hypothetical protein [Weissella confusa]
MFQIQLRSVLRNIRFVIFTLLLPGVWYVLFLNVWRDTPLPSISLLTIAALMGIIGNSVVTFSKRVNMNRGFFQLLDATSSYSSRRFLQTQAAIQITLNFVIYSWLVLIGIVLNKLTLSIDLIFVGGLVSILGLYFSAIGFVVAMKFSGKTLDTLSFPMTVVAGLMIVPFQNFPQQGVIKQLTLVEKFLPGYWFNEVSQKIGLSQHFEMPLLLMMTSVLVTLLIVVSLLKGKGSKIKIRL